MARELSLKSSLIREAILANPDVKNKPLADQLNAAPERLDDKLKFVPNDVAQQRQILKKNGAIAPKKLGRPKGSRNGTRPQETPPISAPTPARSQHSNPVEMIDRLFDMAEEYGGFSELKRLVDRLAKVERA